MKVTNEIAKKNKSFIKKTYGNDVILSPKTGGCRSWIRNKKTGVAVYRCGDETNTNEGLNIYCKKCGGSL